MLLKLKNLSERKLSADEIIQELRPKLQSIPGINAYMQNPPSIRVGGHFTKSTYQYTLQDTDQDELNSISLKLQNALSHAPGFADVTTDMDLSAPAANVDIDRDQAAAQGVSIQSIETALGAAFGGEQISTLYASDAEYWVMLELLPKYQNDPSSINLLYVSSSLGNGGSGAGSGSVNAGTGTATSTAAGTTRQQHAHDRAAECGDPCAHGHHAAGDQPSGPAAVGDHLLQPVAGLCIVRRGDRDRPGA